MNIPEFKEEKIIIVPDALNIYNVADVKDQVLEAFMGVQPVHLDLSEAMEFDSAGFQLLVMLVREARLKGKVFKITQFSEPARKVIELYRMSWLLE